MSDENLSSMSFQEKNIYIGSPVLHASYSFPENGKLHNWPYLRPDYWEYQEMAIIPWQQKNLSLLFFFPVQDYDPVDD